MQPDAFVWFGSLIATSLVTGLVARFFSRSEKAEDTKSQADLDFRAELRTKLERNADDIKSIDKQVAAYQSTVSAIKEQIVAIRERAEKQADKHAEAVDRLTRELENLRREQK